MEALLTGPLLIGYSTVAVAKQSRHKRQIQPRCFGWEFVKGFRGVKRDRCVPLTVYVIITECSTEWFQFRFSMFRHVYDSKLLFGIHSFRNPSDLPVSRWQFFKHLKRGWESCCWGNVIYHTTKWKTDFAVSTTDLGGSLFNSGKSKVGLRSEFSLLRELWVATFGVCPM